ncbi:hypothetical protein ACU635_26310 [[Actinomadura] parvosata]|uniref:hypothetical protein n=1 Tax=[Actinomadura] parvosata TaxID=1955412 RepID=UPI00406C9997
MGLDLSRVPEVVRPIAQPLTGGALPEADVAGIIAEARTMEELADTLAEIRADDAGAVMRLLRDGLWKGAAKETFEQVFAALSGNDDRPGSPQALLDLLEQALRDEARSLREHGVRMQHTEWMIYASLALLGAMIVRLLVWIYVNGPAVLGLIQHHTLLTRVSIQTLKRLVLIDMLRFGGLMGGLDLGVQVAQQLWGVREAGDFDYASLAMSAGSGALTGALFAGANAGLSRLLSREMVYVASKTELAVRDKVVALGQSMYGQALLGGVTGTAGAVPGLALSGQLDAAHLGYTFLSGVAGGLDVPASARVSYRPLPDVAELGVRPGGSPPGPHDGTTLARHGQDPPHAQDAPLHRDGGIGPVSDRSPSPAGETGSGALPPPRGETIVGEVVRRRDTPLPPSPTHVAGGSERPASGPAVAERGPVHVPPERGTHPVPDQQASTTPRPHPGRPEPPPVPAARPAPGDRLSDGYAPIADPRPRNFAEAAAIVHRWTPGDGAQNRIEQLLNGRHTDDGPPDPQLLEHGRHIMRGLPVQDQSDATAAALATMSTSLRAENATRAVDDLATQLFGARRDIDALVDLYREAQRQGMAPEAARDRAEVADVLARTMAADRHRWLGHLHRALLPATTAGDARAAGIIVEAMGPLVTASTVSAFTRPLLQSAGVQTVRQLLPLVRAAHEHGFLPAATTGEHAFQEAMRGFRETDPRLWDGLLVADNYNLTGLGDDGTRLLASLNDIVRHPETGMGRRVVLPLERLATEVGQAGSVEQLLRLAGETPGSAHAAGVRELIELLTAHRSRDPYLWDGLRLATEYGLPRTADAEARALARLAEITAAEPPSRIWVFDPLRRLADQAGLGHSVEELARRTAEAGQSGLDLFGPIDRRQVLDALAPSRAVSEAPAPLVDGSRTPNGWGSPRSLHDLSPSAVREAREAASAHHAQAQREHHQNQSRLRRALAPAFGTDPRIIAERRMVASLEARARAWQRWPDAPEVSFTRDFAAYGRAYDQAVARGLTGEDVIPYLYENATASLGARDGGRGFGLEIEYDLPGGVMTDRALAIPRALHEAGLTADASAHAYHTSKDRGYRSGPPGGRGLWLLEKDSTVLGELVSPILYDEPETWENLRLACEIIRAHGGVASVRTGGHIHVSTHDYDHIVANYTSVLDYAGRHTDTLYRLGHNPEQEGHRGQKWCRPHLPPSAGYSSIAQVTGVHGRESAVNTFGVAGRPTDHIEFRMWDGSLDPAVIQSQVKVSLALVEAAFRNATLDLPPNDGRHDALGAHAGLRPLGSAADATPEGSLSFRRLMDELFWRAADKEQLTALYAITRWADPQEGESPNGTPAP